MASKKKGARTLFARLCKKCNRKNYVNDSHRDTIPSVMNKYCKQCQASTEHKSKDKLK